MNNFDRVCPQNTQAWTREDTKLSLLLTPKQIQEFVFDINPEGTRNAELFG